MHIRFTRSALLFALLLTVAACDSASLEPPAAGTYRSTTFTVSVADSSTTFYDVQAGGGYVEATLLEDGTVEDGVISVPAESPEIDEETRIAFAGTWSQNGDVVQFDHEADTFVRDTEWIYADDGTLRADFSENVGDTTSINVVLTRQ